VSTDVEHQRFTYDGKDFVVCKGRYPDGSLAVLVREQWSRDPYAILSINLPADENPELEDGEFWGKDYSENETLFKILVGLGIIRGTGKWTDLSPFASVESWVLS
jgi:hypothetical protein